MTTRHNRKVREVTRKANRALMTAAGHVEAMTRELEATRLRNDFWRNLLTASAFARGMGDERPISEVVAEVHPELMRLTHG